MNSFLLTENEIGGTHTFTCACTFIFEHGLSPDIPEVPRDVREWADPCFWLILMKVRLYQANVFIDIDIPEYRIPESSFDSD